MRIKGISKEYAELLRVAGVDTVKELKYRNPANLAKAMADANKKNKLVRMLPSEKVVCRWIDTPRKAAAEDHVLTDPSGQLAGPVDSPGPTAQAQSQPMAHARYHR